jgi:hypothetical protein
MATSQRIRLFSTLNDIFADDAGGLWRKKRTIKYALQTLHITRFFSSFVQIQDPATKAHFEFI